MTVDKEEIARFIFGLRLLRDGAGKIFYQKRVWNKGVQLEVIILQLELFLEKIRGDYRKQFSGK